MTKFMKALFMRHVLIGLVVISFPFLFPFWLIGRLVDKIKAANDDENYL